ncbi:alpha/beta hydrolase [Wenzhouxiangella sp. XN201]|uniref:alpha/beta hydrolase n=1 Tax=Wenzhouxiangella sp. XN201 TaxID=2710755 RepID=UPI0013CCACF9|nr:alpha/beta hydrolase [Wenzhouxiangella sp. XN201]NEZ04288.1 alpha/beta hydrolase [Wenzhouxiangella sp. XN201]
MTNSIAFSVVLLACLVLVGCARHLNDPGRDISLPQKGHVVLADQRFSPPDWPQALYADVYIPDGNSPDGNPAAWPAVLVVHGGGWERRSRDDMTRISRQLADRGFVAVNIDYRFAPEYRFPAQLHDVQIAHRWMRDEASRLRIDADRIAGLGFSSGAHLVALAGLVAGTDSSLNAEYGPEDEGFFAVVVGGIPSDFGLFSGGKLLRQLMGARQEEAPEAYRAASPITHVHDDAPPFFLFHGTLDQTVPYEHARVLYEALLEHGVHAELYRMRLRGHITSFLIRGGAMRSAIAFLHDMAGRPADEE